MNVGAIFQLSQNSAVGNGKNSNKPSSEGFGFMLGNALMQASPVTGLDSNEKVNLSLSVEELESLLATLTEDMQSSTDLGTDLESFLSSMNLSVEELMEVMEMLMGNQPSNTLSTLFSEITSASSPEEWVIASSKFLKVLASELKTGEKHMSPQQNLHQVVQLITVFKKFIRQSDQTATTDDISQSLKSAAEDVKGIVEHLLRQKRENVQESKFQQALFRLTTQSTNQTGKVTPPTQGVNGEQVIFSTNTSATLEQVALSIPKGATKLQGEAFVREFTNVLSKANWLKNPMQSKLQINLYPEHLGTLKIELVQKDGVLSARILASSLAAKDMIDTNLSSLKNSFALQNIQVEKVEVFQSSSADFRQSSKEGSQGNQQQDQQPNKQEEANPTKTFLDELSEQLQSTEEDVTS